jgi:hypothetical protein
MKQFKYALVFAGCLSMISSCKRDLLDPVPQTSISDASAFDTPDRILNQVRSLYGAMKNGNFYGGRYVVYGDIRGEDFINETSNLVTGADVWSLNPTNSSTNSIVNLWGQAYFTINACNLFIDGMASKGTSVVGTAVGGNYVAEAKLIRALSYYSLLQYYARPYADGNGSKPGLPLRLTGIKGAGSSDLARSTVAEVYNQVLADLDFAEANLPLDYTGSTQADLRVTRAHRNTAIALKTRVYLSMQKYSNVVTEANKIVSTAGPFTATTGVPHALQANIATVFSNYKTTESILSMPMTSSASPQDYPGTQNSLASYFNKGVGTGEYSLNTSGIYANAGWIATDKRRAFIVPIVTGSVTKYYLNGKYATASPYTDWVPVIRYSEVMLNLAEALARTNAGVDARALALLNAVRQRSDATTTLAPATNQALIDAILLERRIELLGEGLRNNDLMRLLQNIPAKGSAPMKTPADNGYIWPISSTELSLNRLMTDN